ncbi:MAG TPA: hypothetical protein VK138_10425 [Acidiferrobacterales bacterium]|nr:hypothetical protein [Acidiferrobacterales bacterium]
MFARGSIEVLVTDIHGIQVELGFTADSRFLDRWFPTRSTSSIPGVVILREERHTGHKIPTSTR